MRFREPANQSLERMVSAKARRIQSTPSGWWVAWQPLGLAFALAAVIPVVLTAFHGAGVLTIHGVRAAYVAVFPFAALASMVVPFQYWVVLVALLVQLPLYALAMRAAARRGYTRLGWIVVLSLHLVAAGISSPAFWGPSLGEYAGVLQRAAGSGSRDCGVVSLGEPRASAVSCANAAMAARASFSVAFQVVGIDSTVFLGLAGRSDGSATRIDWDSDIHGGSKLLPRRRISERPCRRPSVRDVSGQPSITCSQDEGGAPRN
jgi:hypothetical protein